VTSTTLTPRRILTLAGVVGSLLLGLLTIRAAAAWTAGEAPLSIRPPSVADIEASLQSEQARSAALKEDLDRLTAASAEMANALAAAEQQIATDAAEADTLRASLAAARERLATLERDVALAAAGAGPVGVAPIQQWDDHHGDHDDD
jgi:hypothetical protein